MPVWTGTGLTGRGASAGEGAGLWGAEKGQRGGARLQRRDTKAGIGDAAAFPLPGRAGHRMGPGTVSPLLVTPFRSLRRHARLGAQADHFGWTLTAG